VKTYIGIDNGVSGACAFVNDDGVAEIIKTPTFSEQNYTKAKANISRVDRWKFRTFLTEVMGPKDSSNFLVLFERPMVNPGRFAATISAVRCLEAQLGVVEDLQLPHMYVDSKEWQKVMLPSGLKGKDELKDASLDIGCRLFPKHKKLLISQKDADALLIAEYARRKKL
jgi:hypothetical protein